jgi:hypothetical protein
MRRLAGLSFLMILTASGALQGQQASPAVSAGELDGKWTGSAVIFQITQDDIREDSARFEFTLATGDSGTRGDLLLVTGSNRELTSAMVLEARDSGSVKLAADVSGAHVVFTGSTTDSTMAGSFDAVANGENVGTGNWIVRRSP